MRNYRKALLVYFILISLVVSCTTISPVTADDISIYDLPTKTPEKFPAETQVEPTITKTQHPTPTITPITTPVVTSSSDAYSVLTSFIGGTNKCQLPCWAGIYSGKTTISEAKSILSPLLIISNPGSFFDNNIGSLYISYPNDGLEISIAVVHLPYYENNVISYFQFSAQALQKLGDGSYMAVYNSTAYSKLTSNYSLQKIYSTYHEPSDIFTRLENNIGENTAPDFFYFWVLYPEQGIYLKYTTQVSISKDNATVCPKNSFITVWLLPQNMLAEHKKILSEADSQWSEIYSYPMMFKSLNDAFGISSAEFFELLTKTPEYCLESKVSIWPSP